MPSVWRELKRRNVVKVAVAYAIVGWLLVQIADVFFPALQLPEWTVTFVAALLILGFPVALLLSWAYELTPDGIERTKSVPLSESISKGTGRKLDFVIIGVLVLAVVFLVVDNYVLVNSSGDAGLTADQAEDATADTALRDLRSIAVLPFDNRSAQADDEFFVAGIHDDILTQLTRIASLKVISRTSVMGYQDTDKNMRTIGEELGVATILEGGVQRAGDTVRINVQLIDTETDEHLWAEIYDRELTAENIFEIQSEMAVSIADALQAALSPQEVARLNEVPTTNTPAYVYYVTGNEYFRREDYNLAVQQYESAIVEDPEFALAWARLARAHASIFFWDNDRTDERRALARDAIERAIEVAPNQAATHLAVGYYRYNVFNDYEGALAAWELAEEGMPGDAELYEARGYVYRRLGDVELAAGNLERAVELDPLRDDVLLTLVITYETLRDYARADQAFDRALAIAPDFGEWRRAISRLFRGDPLSVEEARAMQLEGSLLWQVALYDRDYDAALEALEALGDEGSGSNWEFRPIDTNYAMTYQLTGRDDLALPRLELARARILQELDANSDDPRLLIALGEVVARLGDAESAIDLARRAMQLPPASVDAALRPRFRLNAIGVLVAAGDHASAIDELDAYLSEPGEWSIEGLMRDPRLDPIRDDPRVEALVERYGRQ